MQEDERYITKYVSDIREKAKFLEEKGFSIIEVSEFTIEYSRKDCCQISIYYGRYSDEPDVIVIFKKSLPHLEAYGLDWFRQLQRFEAGGEFYEKTRGESKLSSIFSLLDYLQENFDKVTDLKYCREMDRKVNSEIRRHTPRQL